MSSIRELSIQETKQVAGGPVALIPVVLNLAARVVTNQLVQHAIRSAALVGSTYKAAESLSESD